MPKAHYNPLGVYSWFFGFLSEQVSQMRFDHNALLEGVQRSIGLVLGRINIEFLAPDQSRRLALLYNGLEEAAKYSNPLALTDAREAQMVGKQLIQVVPNVPVHPQPIRCMSHEQAFGTAILKEHHQLQLEEDDGINGGTTTPGIPLLHKFAHKRQIQRSFQVSIEMILRYQLFQ